MEKSEKVIIIGAGQAGLSVSYYLTNLKVPHLILEKVVLETLGKMGDGTLLFGHTQLTINLLENLCG